MASDVKSHLGWEDIRELVASGHNLFLTGPGGVGKSFYVKKMKEWLGTRLHVTSTTGVSSYNLTGRTIHSFAGLGAFKASDTFDYTIKRIQKNPQNTQRWRTCEILVIDEVSMMGKKMLDMLDLIARHCRHSDKPFGGIQVIFTGDFLQLPPIDDEYAFLSPVWESLALRTIYLTKMYRVADPVFTDVLARIRVGKPTPEDNVLLFGRVAAFKKWQAEHGDDTKESLMTITPTWMYSRKVDVHEKNMEELEKNPNQLMQLYPEFLGADKRPTKVPGGGEPLLMKVGAQVMLTVNFDTEAGLVNGSRGVVVAHNSDEKTLRVRFLDSREIDFERYTYTVEVDGRVKYYVEQFPFILAYALSIHKVQGCTLDYAVMDLGYSVFENSMSYVALSRVRSLDGLFLTAYQPYRIKCDEGALAFYENLSTSTSST